MNAASEDDALCGWRYLGRCMLSTTYLEVVHQSRHDADGKWCPCIVLRGTPTFSKPVVLLSEILELLLHVAGAIRCHPSCLIVPLCILLQKVSTRGDTSLAATLLRKGGGLWRLVDLGVQEYGITINWHNSEITGRVKFLTSLINRRITCRSSYRPSSIHL